MILRARMLLPMEGPAIENGAVVLTGDRVAAAGGWSDVRRHCAGAVADLGECVLIPGLVNAHAHLDYTRMAGRLPPPREFADWIQGILALKGEFGYSEYAEAWLAGARMLWRHGTTTVVDIEAVPELLPEVWASVPLRVISCLELIGVRGNRSAAEILGDALDRMDQLPAGRCATGLSPHAPYSAGPELLRLAVAASRDRGCLLTTHVAESASEYAMFREAAGALYGWLSRNGRDMGDCGRCSPVRHLARLGYLSDRLLAVHGNYLEEGDAALLGEHGTHVVHCPRSHAYFGHAPFPYELLRRAGVNVALGTDSLASVRAPRAADSVLGGDDTRFAQAGSVDGGGRRGEKPPRTAERELELDLFAEMRAFHASHPDVDPESVLAMATRRGALALGWSEWAGRLGPGGWADLAVLRVAPGLREAYEAVVDHRGPVDGLMIAGEWVIEPGARDSAPEGVGGWAA